MAHVHAENMRLYAEDAAETDTPWDRWEVKAARGWGPLYAHPKWIEVIAYRRKRRTININGYEIPEPVREPLEEGQLYYYASTCSVRVEWRHWRSGGPQGERRLYNGLIHSTHEAAQIHLDALLSFTRRDEE